MPTYEYRCPEGHEFERFYKTISAAKSEASCPECGATAGRMMSAGAGLLFKGSGFYLTDYGKNAHRGAPSAAEKGGEKGGDKGGEAPAASKSEGKTDASKSDTSKTEAPKAARAEAAKPKAESSRPDKKKPKAE